MKILIPKTRHDFEIKENTINITKMDTSKIIVLKGDWSTIGILTKVPVHPPKWFITDLFMANNFWATISEDPTEVFDPFYANCWQIIQFDHRQEFLAWLNKNMPNEMNYY